MNGIKLLILVMMFQLGSQSAQADNIEQYYPCVGSIGKLSNALSEAPGWADFRTHYYVGNHKIIIDGANKDLIISSQGTVNVAGKTLTMDHRSIQDILSSEIATLEKQNYKFPGIATQADTEVKSACGKVHVLPSQNNANEASPGSAGAVPESP